MILKYYAVRLPVYFYIFCNRKLTAEQEAKLIDDESKRRIESAIAERVNSEMELRKNEIEEEVKRRVEEAKRVMEQTMIEELERRKRLQKEEEFRRQVWEQSL